jgi:hypothetical protein
VDEPTHEQIDDVLACQEVLTGSLSSLISSWPSKLASGGRA